MNVFDRPSPAPSGDLRRCGRSPWARRAAWLLAVLLVPAALAVPLANAFDPTLEEQESAAQPAAPVGLQAPVDLPNPEVEGMQSPDVQDLEQRAAKGKAAEAAQAPPGPEGQGQPPAMSPWSAAAAQGEANGAGAAQVPTGAPTATPTPAAAQTAEPARNPGRATANGEAGQAPAASGLAGVGRTWQYMDAASRPLETGLQSLASSLASSFVPPQDQGSAPVAPTATPTPPASPADPITPAPPADSAPPGSQAAIDLAAAKAWLDEARAKHILEVQRVLQYVQQREATPGDIAKQPKDVEDALRQDPTLIDDDPSNKPPSLVERRASATAAVDRAEGVLKSVTPEDINAAEARVAQLTGELDGLTGEALTRKALDVAVAQAELDELRTTLAQARAERADARTTRHVNDVWYRDRILAILLEVDRDTAVNQAKADVERAEASYRQAQLDYVWSEVAREMPVMGGTVDVAWGIWRPVGRATMDLARFLDHIVGPP